MTSARHVPLPVSLPSAPVPVAWLGPTENLMLTEPLGATLPEKLPDPLK